MAAGGSRRGPLVGYALGVFAFCAEASANPQLSVWGGAVKTGEVARVSVRLSHDEPVEGFRLALRVKSGEARVLQVSLGESVSAAGAERALLRVLPDGITADVLLDAEPPFLNQSLPPGEDREVLVLRIEALLSPAPDGPPAVCAISFTEEASGAAFPAMVRVGGREVGRNEGLELAGGQVSVFPISEDILTIPDMAFDCLTPTPIAVPVLLTNASGPVEAFTLSVAHEPFALELKEIALSGTVTEEEAPEFVDVDLYPDGGTIGVVLDILPPFDGQTIPRGNDRPIASFRYDPVDLRSLERANVSATLRFVEGVFGEPPLSNLLVVGGRSRRPVTTGGTITLYPCDIGPIQFCLGEPGPGGVVISPIGYRGQECLRVGLFYRSPFFLQGLQMAITYDECLTGVEGSVKLVNPESLIAIVGNYAERQIDFFNYHFDNGRADGDGRELVLGLLVEALPPFEDKRLRDSDVPLLFAEACFQVCDTTPAPAVLPIEFREGLDGRGKVKIFNRAVVDDRSIRPEFCQRPVLVLDRPPPLEDTPDFVRGDCNMSGMVEVSDAAALVAVFGFRHVPPGAIVYPIHFDPPCLDACDSNDDGRVDLADMVAILWYLFKQGQTLPAPGPENPGPDSTEDKLTCEI